MVSLGNNVTMTCLLNYNGPTHDNPVYPLSPDQDPRISVYFGSEDLTLLASEVHVPGSAVQPIHNKTLVCHSHRSYTFVKSITSVWYGDAARIFSRWADNFLHANFSDNCLLFSLITVSFLSEIYLANFSWPLLLLKLWSQQLKCNSLKALCGVFWQN